MCSFDIDGEVCEVYEVTHPRSRNERECIVCCASIAKGETYERHSMIYEGTASSECICASCAMAVVAFREDPHHRGSPSPSGFAEALRECFHGAEKDDPEAKLWRDLYAGVLRRGLGRRFIESRRERRRRFPFIVPARAAEERPA